MLEGPQGTLYGASSEAGTVRIITNKPDPTQVFGELRCQRPIRSPTAGQGYKADGFVNIPIIPIAAVRLVGYYEHDPGYINNVAGTNRMRVS